MNQDWVSRKVPPQHSDTTYDFSLVLLGREMLGNGEGHKQREPQQNAGISVHRDTPAKNSTGKKKKGLFLTSKNKP
jgi:hypothetical protein